MSNTKSFLGNLILLLSLVIISIYITHQYSSVRHRIVLNPLSLTITVSSPKKSCADQHSEHFKQSVNKSEQIYSRFLANKRSKQNPLQTYSKAAPYTLIFDKFLPAFDCPFSVQRIGKLGDGGKWMCGIEIFEQQPQCVVYSFGINYETSFESEILDRTSCQIFAYDGSVSDVVGISSANKDRVHFSQVFGGPTNISKTFVTLGDAMRKNKHDWIDILKVDVEGSEFAMMKQIKEEFTQKGYFPFGQLLIEIHPRLNKAQDNKAELRNFFTMLEGFGLRPFRNELNLGPPVQGDFLYAVAEYSFLNTRRFC